MFWTAGFIFAWLFWIAFANKNRWKEIFPVSVFASWLSFIAEAWMHYVHELWSYSGTFDILPLFANAFGIYIVVPYFFIQWLPAEKTLATIFKYIFSWTAFAITFEYIHWIFLQIEYHLWWNIGCSYIADWILFCMFYGYYNVTGLKKLQSS